MVGDYLGFATGQCFGGTTPPAVFDIASQARQQHATWLWENKPAEVMTRADSYVADMSLSDKHTPTSDITFAKANYDSKNNGVFKDDGSRIPPPFPHQVDDCMFADVKDYFRLTSAASIVALEDVFGIDHPHQEKTLSLEKLELAYYEGHHVVGQQVDTRRMVVEISPRRRNKIIKFIQTEDWLNPQKRLLCKRLLLCWVFWAALLNTSLGFGCSYMSSKILLVLQLRKPMQLHKKELALWMVL